MVYTPVGDLVKLHKNVSLTLIEKYFAGLQKQEYKTIISDKMSSKRWESFVQLILGTLSGENYIDFLIHLHLKRPK